MSNYVIFDTETTSLEKPFCYNIGYVIINEKGKILLTKDFVVEQIWHNLPLFTSAYYAEKRPIYINAMRSRKSELEKFGYITSQMIRDFKNYDVVGAYAYNSPFDDKVFTFNCDWFKVRNPFDTIDIFDIRGYVHQFIVDDMYKEYCDNLGFYTETGNYSTTAETVYRYITDKIDFIEEHTALSDSLIETDILIHCINEGANFNKHYQTFRSVENINPKDFTLKLNNEIIFNDKVDKITYRKKDNTVLLTKRD